MFKFLLSIILPLCLLFSTTTGLYGMTEGAVQSEEEVVPDAEQETSPSPTATMPEAPSPAPGMPTPPAPGMPTPPPAEATPSPAMATAEEVKSEKLGEFEIKEDLPDITKNVDPKIITLIQKANELSKQVNEIIFSLFVKEIPKDINNMLDTFYQKASFDWGKSKESLKAN